MRALVGRFVVRILLTYTDFSEWSSYDNICNSGMHKFQKRRLYEYGG